MIVHVSVKDEPLSALRIIAHLEAGDDVLYDGDLAEEPWWPSVEAEAMRITEGWLNG